MEKRLIVIGGAGFIGSNFIRYWLNKYPQDFIINLDAVTYAGNPESLSDVQADKQENFYKICCKYKNNLSLIFLT